MVALQATARGDEDLVFALKRGHAGMVLITLDTAMCKASEQSIFEQHTIASRCSNDVLDRGSTAQAS